MNKSHYQWLVVGAGPAGIAVVSKLLSKGVNSKEIAWVDPYFQVGDLGRLWPSVSGNTKISLFIDFLEELEFYKTDPSIDLLQLPKDSTCLLKHVADPLLTVSQQLQKEVDSMLAEVSKLEKGDECWHVSLNNNSVLKSKRVVLATGATPLSQKNTLSEISLATALDKKNLAREVSRDDCVVVYGASHSAIIVLKHLVDLGVDKIINVYKKPCQYAKEMNGHILFDNTGLKGLSAEWALENIEKNQPANLKRYHLSDPKLGEKLKVANKAVYAIGFKPRNTITSSQYDLLNYDKNTGIIASGLFGFGIAYPEQIISYFGQQELQVGLWKFMQYLKRVLPIWLSYPT